MDRQKELLGKLADRGEDAISKLADVAGGNRFLDAATALRDRLDELQKRVRGVDALERRVTDLEKRLAKLEKKPATARRGTARATTSRRRQASSPTGTTARKRTPRESSSG